MKILFVRPEPSDEIIGLQHLMIVEPLELEILSALKRKQDVGVLIDMIIEKKPFEHYIKEHKPDVVCLTGYITNVNTIIHYCDTVKNINPKTITVVGGVHCEVCPEDFEAKSIDYRVVRNGGVNFTALLNHIDNGSILPLGVLQKGDKLMTKHLPDYNFNIPTADRNISEKYRDKYFYIFHDKVALIKTSFGCPYKCSFCFCRRITQDHYHQRPLDEVIDELKQIKEKEIYIVDDDFLHDRTRLKAFISAVKDEGIDKRYLVYGRADFIADNPDIIEEFAQIGLRTVIVGFETFSKEELEKYNKKIDANKYKQTMENLIKNNVECFATVIVSPDWDKADFRCMEKQIKSLNIHYVNLQPLTPLPKTGIEYNKDSIIIDRSEYEKWDLAHVTIKPTKLSVAEYYRQILKSYYSIMFQPKILLSYIFKYPFRMLLKMFYGSRKVTKQYYKKIKEAEELN